MSTRRDPVRVVEQLAIGGGIDIVELHGLGGRTRENVVHCRTAGAAGRVVHDAQQFLGAELVAGKAGGDLERPCPRCSANGDPEEVFGFRFVHGRRIRQSWCRGCRRSHRRAA